MAWERGYYYRVRRENGRVVREYVGCGRSAEIIAQLDELGREQEREERHRDAEALRKEKAKLDALDAGMETLTEITDQLARAALVAAGYHQHKRGEWRKRRGCWLQVQSADISNVQAKDISVKWYEFLQRRMNHSHKRYLSALKTLALVRKLAVPYCK